MHVQAGTSDTHTHTHTRAYACRYISDIGMWLMSETALDLMWLPFSSSDNAIINTPLPVPMLLGG